MLVHSAERRERNHLAATGTPTRA